MRRRAVLARGAVIGLLLGLSAALATPTPAPAVPAGAGTAADARPGSYAFTPGARTVAGTKGTTDAALLDPRHTYRSSLPRNGRLYYRLRLTAADTAYVPVTAVPPADATVSATDGIRVSLRDANGASCFYASARIGAGLSPRPVTALAQREAGKALCQGAGTYYLLVERLDAEGSGAAAGSEPWDLEIAPATEPRLAEAGPTTAPRTWDSATPEPLTGTPRDRSGGTGFATARPVGQGIWRTRLTPGETRFYKVPLDWGRQLHASAGLDGAPGHGYVGGALNLSLYNPVRDHVDDASLGYTGTPRSAALAPLPPVEYANRYAVPAGVASVRFAGEYYLVLHLSTRLADTFGPGPFEVTLRVRVRGRQQAGPAYAGRPVPDDLLTVTDEDRDAAVTGDTGGGADGRLMRLVAVGGIGTGTALLLVLGGWTVAARRVHTRVNAQKPTA
ncbi:hypothetical protein SHJG_5206 [Streptomyces hygroscopicus subsp. jinggangensis 5008]|nr:hypothetical protein SHJG_5206 [Streptomyces hygroscopicus subsp. jinggangensis 5008]AGF64633.1 hypothetical protein SHJGH_4970 [Streptomyces hygroscopicus subsp. jinggangensis TL01]